MKRVAIVDAAPEEQLFFKEILHRHDIVLSFPKSVADVDPATNVIAVFVRTSVHARDISRLPNLTHIACRSTGYNNIDLDFARQRGITVTNVPSYGGVTVAEYTIALLLMLSRRMLRVVAETPKANPNRSAEEGFDLSGRTIGVIGTGAIGQGVARIAAGIGMKVIGYDLYPDRKAAAAIGFTYADDANVLLRASDIISLHMPATKDNIHFLNAARLAKLKPGAIVLNTARGELVDTKALIAALKHGHVAGAGIDVVEDAYATALGSLPNVILTNHNAYNTTEALERINQVTADNILGVFDGKKVHTV